MRARHRLASPALPRAGAAQAQTTVRVGWCARTVSSAAAPFAIATKMGWFAEAGIKVEIVPLPGSTDCVKSGRDQGVQYSLPSIEPLAIIRPQGVKAKNYYTAYQGNIYGIAVPEDSPIQKSFADLKGKKIGVTSMASAGVIVAARARGEQRHRPGPDVTIVVAGEAAQTAALLRCNQVDALSAVRHAIRADRERRREAAHARAPRTSQRFPSNGLIALEETLQDPRARAVALGAGLCQGHDVRDRQPGGGDPHPLGGVPADQADRQGRGDAMRDDIKTLEARMRELAARAGGVTKWGENSEANYRDYVDFLLKNGVIKQKAKAPISSPTS